MFAIERQKTNSLTYFENISIGPSVHPLSINHLLIRPFNQSSDYSMSIYYRCHGHHYLSPIFIY